MTQVEERTDAAEPENEEKAAEPRKPKQPALELGAPPRWTYAVLDIEKVTVDAFGSPPEQGLIRSVEAMGVLEPILVDAEWRLLDGRRRLVAAIKAELAEIPALVLVSGDYALLSGTVPLAANDPRASNPIIELEAIEELLRQVQGVSMPTIANALGVSLKTLRARIRLSSLRHEIREAWKAGKFGTKVGEAAARCDEMQQAELVRRLEAEGTITIADVKDVRRVAVSTHQRTTVGDRKVERAVEELTKVRKDLFLDLGDKHPAIIAIGEAIEALQDG